MWAQFDIERAEKSCLNFLKIVHDFRAIFNFSYLKKIRFWKLKVTVFGVWTNYFCLKDYYDIRKNK